MARISQSAHLARETKAISGIQKRLQGMTFIVLGVAYSAEEIEALFQSHLDAAAAVATLRGKLAAAVKTAHELTARAHTIFLALQSILRIQCNNAPDFLADVGMVPRKVAHRSPGTNLVAAVKGKVTRRDRGTLGKAQRRKLKSSLTPAQLAAAVAAAVAPALPDE